MRIHCLRGLVVLALALCAQRASAFLDPPYVTPTNPTAGELVSVSIYGGECDLLDYGIVWPPPVTQQGNSITILFTGVHEEDPEWCYYGVGTATVPIGRYPLGSYTLDVERRYGTPFGTWNQETLGIIPFTVSGTRQQPIEAPTLSFVGLGALLLAQSRWRDGDQDHGPGARQRDRADHDLARHRSCFLWRAGCVHHQGHGQRSPDEVECLRYREG